MDDSPKIRIVGTDLTSNNAVIVELSDDRVFTFSLDQLLSLNPLAVATAADNEG